MASYILMRGEPASAELLAVEAAAIGPNNGPSQQQPHVVIMVGHPQLSTTGQADGAQKKPAVGQQPPTDSSRWATLISRRRPRLLRVYQTTLVGMGTTRRPSQYVPTRLRRPSIYRF
jgi:hypothetical protein